MTRYLLAGGGTAGHVNPLLATADAIREREPEAEIVVLGTKEGLEARLVPERGYELSMIPKVPFPRRLNKAALKFPNLLRRARGRAIRLDVFPSRFLGHIPFVNMVQRGEKKDEF